MGNVTVVPRPAREARACNGNPSPRKAARLTDEQRAFAEERLHLCEVVAIKVSKKCPYMSLEDLYQAAFEGMADAIKGFDPSRGVKFESYADRRMVGACQDMMREQGLIRTPRGEGQNSFVSIARRWKDTGVAGHEDVSYEDIFLSPADVPAPGDAIESSDTFEAWLRGLGDAEKFIMREYYGPTPRSMKQIGFDLGTSESRVSQLHDAILARLREKATFPQYRELAVA